MILIFELGVNSWMAASCCVAHWLNAAYCCIFELFETSILFVLLFGWFVLFFDCLFYIALSIDTIILPLLINQRRIWVSLEDFSSLMDWSWTFVFLGDSIWIQLFKTWIRCVYDNVLNHMVLHSVNLRCFFLIRV